MKQEDLYRILTRVQEYLSQKKYAFIIPEHLLLAIIQEPRFKEIAIYCKSDIDKIQNSIEEIISKQETVLETADILPTQEYNNTLKNAQMIAESSNSEIKVEHFLLSMLGNGSESFCFYVLMTNGISERKIKQFLSRNAGFGDVKFAVNLTQKALNGEFDKLIGRDREIERLIQVLHKKRSSCACLVGNPGTGKTAVIEGLAQRIANGNVPPTLENTGVWALDMGAIVAGTKLRGEFEERLKQTIESVLKNKNVILFIDELHMISGAGATSDGSMDAGNILKPYLTRNDFKCVGATTYEEYKKHIQKDKALARRFKKIDVLEPSKSETLQILQGIRGAYECFHGIKYPDNILELIVDLSEKYLFDQFFPDKAIELMDEIGSKYRSGLKQGEEASEKDVEELICSIANIPSVKVKDSEKVVLKDLSGNIKKELFGQDEIIDKIVKRIKIAKAGLTNKNKPLAVFGMIGNSGVGKTELAKLLAKHLGISFLKFDMSEYSEKNSTSKLIGTSPGYVGFEQAGALTEPLIRNPHCVVLFDEIEKADPAIYDLLLQVMDEGRLTDNNNREASFRNSIILMTSNVGCSKAESSNSYIGFIQDKNKKEDILDKSLKEAFSPEFRNRFTEIFRFSDLSKESIKRIVEKEIRKLNDNLSDKKIGIELTEKGIDFIVNNAVKEKMGGRPVERLVNKYVSEQIVDKILFEDFYDQKIIFDEINGDLKIVPKQ